MKQKKKAVRSAEKVVKMESPGIFGGLMPSKTAIPKGTTLEDMVKFAHSIGCDLTIELIPLPTKRKPNKLGKVGK